MAVTRGRHRMEGVAPFHGADLPDSTNKSVQRLKRYLQYAEQGPAVLARVAPDADAAPESPFAEDMVAVLRDWGYDAQPQMGVAWEDLYELKEALSMAAGLPRGICPAWSGPGPYAEPGLRPQEGLPGSAGGAPGRPALHPVGVTGHAAR
ncbi:hypothetical protein AB0B06_16170 [Streptomyces sp. NPDC044989]|uniref:hypothetical protein n=1 Tax=Streptomyces sp. NPDC044989 TaxID=3154336 RepID=UPI00340D64D2